MSCFFILTALLLVGLMFLFNLESRATQLGMLRAACRFKQVRRLLITEAALVAIVGAVLGLCGAVLYARWVLGALSGEWGGAVGGLRFEAAFRPARAQAGAAAAAALLAIVTVWLAAWRLGKISTRGLAGGGGPSGHKTSRRETPTPHPFLAVAWHGLLVAFVRPARSDWEVAGRSRFSALGRCSCSREWAPRQRG